LLLTLRPTIMDQDHFLCGRSAAEPSFVSLNLEVQQNADSLGASEWWEIR
jgi:hypothetical protein